MPATCARDKGSGAGGLFSFFGRQIFSFSGQQHFQHPFMAVQKIPGDSVMLGVGIFDFRNPVCSELVDSCVGVGE
jgi:hypothetical protein